MSNKRVMALIDHPNLDLLLGPVLLELSGRGIDARALVTGSGQPERLKKMGVDLVAENLEFDHFLAETGPRVMINGADMIPQHHLGIHIDMLCRAAQVPTLTVEHAPFSLAYDGVFPAHIAFAADRMAVIGQEDRNQYEEMGIDPERLRVTGCPAFDALVRARQDHGAEPSGVVIFGQNHTWAGPRSSQGHDPDAWSQELARMFGLLAERFPGKPIRVKPHPAEPHHRTVDLYTKHAGDLPIEVVSPEADNAQLILDSKLVISFSSSVWLEARILGRPCGFFTLLERRSPLAQDVAAMGGVWIAGNTVDISVRLEPHLDALCAQVADPPDELLLAYAGPTDGYSAARIADVVEELMVSGPPPVPMPSLVFDRPEVHPRLLRPEIPYETYIHMQALADEVMACGVEQPLVLEIGPEESALPPHLPLAFLTRHAVAHDDDPHLPFEDNAFDVVVAPELWTDVAPSARPRLLAEMARVARRRIVTSMPTAEGARQREESVALLGRDDIAGTSFISPPAVVDVEADMADLEEQGAKIRSRPCHHLMSWSQSLIIESLGLDEASLGAVRASLQAVGHPQEARGTGARVLHIIKLKGEGA